MTRPRVVPVVAAVIHEDGKFLLHERKSGALEFPGGKVKHGETPEDALKREIREELGDEANLIILEPFYVQSNIYTHGMYVVTYYRCKLKKPDRGPMTLIGCSYIDLESINDYDAVLLPGTIQAVKRYVNHVLHWQDRSDYGTNVV